MNEEDPSKEIYAGRMIKFEPGSDKGVIETEGGQKFKFHASAMSGRFPSLQSRPAVYFQLDDDKVSYLRFDPEAPPFKFAPASGLKLRGAQKCLSCDWRLPMIPEKSYKHVRNGKTINCPKCGQSMKLKSWFNYAHKYIGALFLISTYISYRFIPFIDLWIFSILLFIGLFIFVYAQGKFVPIDVDEVFD